MNESINKYYIEEDLKLKKEYEERMNMRIITDEKE